MNETLKLENVIFWSSKLQLLAKQHLSLLKLSDKQYGSLQTQWKTVRYDIFPFMNTTQRWFALLKNLTFL